MTWQLEVVRGLERGRRFFLDGSERIIGRSQAAPPGWIGLPDGSVSREQCALRYDARTGYCITNLSRTNPTRVNGRGLEGEQALRDGDEIRLGNVVLRVRVGAPAAGPEPPRAVALSGPTVRAAPRPSVECRRADVAQALGHIGLMLTAGIPLGRALESLSDKRAPVATREMCTRLLLRVRLGDSLSDAMREEPSVFSLLQVESVAAGEAVGRLDRVLADVARWEERDQRLIRAVLSGLTYPLVVFAAGVLVVMVLGTRVFATLRPVLTQGGRSVPLLTRALFAVSDALSDPLVAALLLAIGLLGIRWLRARMGSVGGRAAARAMAGRLPVVGSLSRKLFVARFSGHLSLLYGSGLPLVRAMQSAAEATDAAAPAREAAALVAEGVTLAESLRRVGAFPPLAVHLAAAGEASGRLAAMLARISEIYDGEVYDAIETAVRLLEPVVIVAMGLMVSIIVLGTLMPLYGLVAV